MPIVHEATYSYSESSWNQLVAVAQAHAGAIASNTPAMQYSWEDGASGSIRTTLKREPGT